MTLMIGGLNLTATGMSLIVVILAQQQRASSFAIGVILAVGSVGGIVGATFASFLLKRLKYGQGISLVCWCNALILPLFALAPNLLILALVLTLYLIWGYIMGVFNFTYRTALTPDAMQGRVLGISSLVVRGSVPVGLALTGLLLQRFGAVPTVVIFAVYRVFLALIVTFNPHVRKAPFLNEIHASN